MQVKRGGVPVEGIDRVRVGEELRKETLENVEEVVEGRPGLVDHVEAHCTGSLVNVRVVHLPHQNQHEINKFIISIP